MVRVYNHTVFGVIVNKDLFSMALLEARQVVLWLLPLLWPAVSPSYADIGNAS